MNIFHLFFGFGGRLNRAKYWLVTVVWIAIWVVALVAALVILGANWPDSDLPADEKRSAYLDILLDYAAIFVPLFVIGWISALAVGIRRLHDRNKSGWWIVLFYFGPAVIEIFRQAPICLALHPSWGLLPLSSRSGCSLSSAFCAGLTGLITTAPIRCREVRWPPPPDGVRIGS